MLSNPPLPSTHLSTFQLSYLVRTSYVACLIMVPLSFLPPSKRVCILYGMHELTPTTDYSAFGSDMSLIQGSTPLQGPHHFTSLDKIFIKSNCLVNLGGNRFFSFYLHQKMLSRFAFWMDHKFILRLTQKHLKEIITLHLL